MEQPSQHFRDVSPAQQHTAKKTKKSPKRLIILLTVVVVAIALVLTGAVLWFSQNDSANKEYSKVAPSRYQAVFLNGGQVYFGKIKSIDTNYTELTDVYYLNVNATDDSQQTPATTSDNVSLVKLGCELHGPEDKMILKNVQISFWENLKTDAQVATAISQWKQQNPDGQKCSTTSGSTDQAPVTDNQ